MILLGESLCCKLDSIKSFKIIYILELQQTTTNHIFIDALHQRNERITYSKGHLKHSKDSLSYEPSKDTSIVTSAKLEHLCQLQSHQHSQHCFQYLYEVAKSISTSNFFFFLFLISNINTQL